MWLLKGDDTTINNLDNYQERIDYSEERPEVFQLIMYLINFLQKYFQTICIGTIPPVTHS